MTEAKAILELIENVRAEDGQDMRKDALIAIFNVTRAIGYLEKEGQSPECKQVADKAIDNLAFIMTFVRVQPKE